MGAEPVATQTYDLQDLKPWHEAVVDYMLINPTATLADTARHFGKSYGWVCTLIKSDAFKEYKALRFQQHQERVSEGIIARTSKLAERSLDTMVDRIERDGDNISLDFLREAANLSLNALGYGPKARGAEPSVVQLNFNAAPPAVLEAAREDMRRLHSSNTRPRDVDDAEVVEQSRTARALDEAE